jgi:hypothetical protein
VEALEGPLEEKAIPDRPEPELVDLDAAEPEELLEPEELAEAEEPEPPEPKWADHDAADLEELAGPEEPEPPEPESADHDAAEPEELAGPEEPEPPEPESADHDGADLEELAGPEQSEPENRGQETMAELYGIDPLAFEDFDKATAIGNLASAIEFSPESEELEQEKEDAAKSMAEHFEIQSPASIFSPLSELEFKPEPMEELEILEREWPEPDDSPETEMEELRSGFASPQLSIPFQGALNSELAVLMVENENGDAPAAPEETEAGELETPRAPETGAVVTERDGVIYINKSILNPDRETLKGLDRNFKNLIDSILNNT